MNGDKPSDQEVTPDSAANPDNEPHASGELLASNTGEPSPSRIFILRPIATTLLMVAVLLAGFVGYSLLPQSALPEVDYPTIQVTTLYPGASPDVITSSITSPPVSYTHLTLPTNREV